MAHIPVFTNMLPEGANRKIVCRSWRLDEKDFFGLLLKIATYDTIGAITVKKYNFENPKSLMTLNDTDS